MSHQRRKKTKRERMMILNRKRFKHELRKRGRDKNEKAGTVTKAGFAPSILSMWLATLTTRRMRGTTVSKKEK